MEWNKKFTYVPQYELVSCNQHGNRFKYKGTKQICVARISCKRTDADGLMKLILLSHILNVPVRYVFEGDQEAYIEVVSHEALRESV